jgi:4-hydroxy-3-polyprenylbenzoate decarboxylase
VGEYGNRGGRMPVAVVLGGDPAVQMAAAAPLPSAVDPLGLAGLLREKPLDAVGCRSIDLLVPAESDFIIEGHIEPAEPAVSTGPRLSLMGQVLSGRPGHVLHVTALTHRANRVFPAMVPGVGNECFLRDRLAAQLFLPYLKLRIPELVDVDLPPSGGARHVAVLAIRKTYAGQARQVATAAWGMRPFAFARLLVVVDADLDVRDAEQVLAAVAREAHCTDDVWELAGPGDPLDPTSAWGELNRRLAVDATRNLAGEGRTPHAAHPATDDDIEKLVGDRWAEYGLGPEPSL